MNSDFRQYRLKLDYAESSIKIQDSYLRKFFAWLIQNQKTIETINNQDLILYLSNERKKNNKPTGIYQCLQTVKIYLDYEIERGTIKVNPAKRIKLHDKEEKALFPPIDKETLDKIYKEFTEQQARTNKAKRVHQRDIILLGLLIFQGLDSGNLKRLTVKDINLAEGTIYIASNRQSSARTLKLESAQILSIHHYITSTQTDRTKENYLFVNRKLEESVSRCIRKLKENYPELQSPGHIRQSVIINWLKSHPIRQVQYMAGHKKVRSTERYRAEDVNDLLQQVTKFHPLQ